MGEDIVQYIFSGLFGVNNIADTDDGTNIYW